MSNKIISFLNLSKVETQVINSLIDEYEYHWKSWPRDEHILINNKIHVRLFTESTRGRSLSIKEHLTSHPTKESNQYVKTGKRMRRYRVG